MRCPRKWKWGYLDGLRSIESNDNLDLGTFVHQALQEHYKGRDALAWIGLAERELMDRDEFRPKWLDLGLIMVEGYLDWLAETGCDAYLEPVMIEEQLEMDLGVIRGRHVTLHGTIDLVHSNPDGQLFIIDHKTCASFEALAHRRMQLSFQLQTYDLLLTTHWGQAPTGAIYNMLRKVKRSATAKPPFFMREMVSFNAHQRAAFKVQLRNVVDALLRAEGQAREHGDNAMYPVVDQDCTWKCPFLQVCAMRDDGSDITGALNDLYIRSDER